MRAKPLVLLSNRSILTAGVQRLLQEIDRFEVATVETSDPQWAATVKHLAPSVIVLDSSDDSLGKGVITRLLEEHPRARVIALNLNHTGIEVYRMKRVLHTGVDGLLEAIGVRQMSSSTRHEKCLINELTAQDGGDIQTK